MTTDRDLSQENKTSILGLTAKNWMGTFFGVSQEVFDQVWENLTGAEGNSLLYITMEIGADPDVFDPVRTRLEDLKISKGDIPPLDNFIRRHLTGPRKVPNYGGGLGILAGDTLKSMSSCHLPATAVSLFYHKGYFSQVVDARLGQIDWATEWRPEETPSLYLLKSPFHPEKPLQIEIPFFDEKDRTVMAYAQIWMKMEINENLDFFIPELLLDYSVDSSPSWIREAAAQLYDSSSERTKAIQRRMLGAGILPVMDILGITSKVIHLNEQHGVVAVLHLIADRLLDRLGAEYQLLATDEDIFTAAGEVSQRVVYTIHTPVKAGHDRFDKSLYAGLSHSFCQRVLNLLAQDEEHPGKFNFTALAMKVNRATNSVSRLHREVTRRQFPQYHDKITAITNGVHHLTWISDAKAALFDSRPELSGWRQDPSVFANITSIRNDVGFRSALERAWYQDTSRLTNYVNRMLSTHRQQAKETWIDPPNYLSLLDKEETPLDPTTLTLGFARRFSTYKRASLIFEDIDRLAGIIVSHGWPVNFLFSGKAHPADEPGKSVIKRLLDYQQELYEKSRGLAKLVFIPGYDMSIAKLMVAGVHGWLNNPKRPLEASGTSGMKAAMNGIPNISILDGWWVEGYHDGQTGWKFGHEDDIESTCLSEEPDALLYAEDATSFYELFPEILTTFHTPELRPQYINRCIMNLVLNIPIFNTHRMTAEYADRYDIDFDQQVNERMKKFRRLYQSEAPST